MQIHFNNPIKGYAVPKVAAVALTGIILGGYNVWALDVAQTEANAKEEFLNEVRSSQAGPYATDGTFTGTAEGYGGDVTTQVVIENGWIQDVQILDASDEDEAWLEMAEVLPDRIAEAQTSNIDVVSGATFTSVGILNGATEALIDSLEQGGEAW